jgi:glycosyltransferase involved in cell wall biosynthesis
MSTKRKRILLYCEMPEGGMAEHSHYQANALTRAGVETFVMASRGFLPDHAGKNYTLLSWLVPIYPKIKNRLLKAVYFAAAMVINELIFAFRILFWGHRHILLAGSSEKLALIWVWPHVLLRGLGVRYAANIHDPQRKRLEGSALLHRWAIGAGFLPVSYGLIHEDFDSEQPDIPAHVVCLPVPYGCYEAHVEPGDGAALRAGLVPAEEERYVFLAFGYVADRKNIDLCIRAIADLPKAVLVVAGRLASVHDKPAAYYRALATELGCADRVRIDEGFIPEGAVRDYFGASDAILLTYKAEFVSQSGVLLLASNWGKPVLASSGPGPLSRTVSKFDLGPTVPADDIVALRAAMEQLIEHGYDAAGWPAFRHHASWDRNVDALLRAFDRDVVIAAPAGEMT